MKNKGKNKINPSMHFSFSLDEEEMGSIDFTIDRKEFNNHNKRNSNIEIVDLKKYKHGRRKRNTSELF